MKTIPIVAAAVTPAGARADSALDPPSCPLPGPAADLLRCAVPAAWGGLGGGPQDLEALLSAQCQASLPVAIGLWCQRTAIEFLLQSPNVALRELLLPDWLSSQRAATLPLTLDAHALQATDTGRGWRLSGHLPALANAPATGFDLVAPIAQPHGTGWGLLRSEDDGMHPGPGLPQPTLQAAHPASLRVEQVFFREDEWLGEGPALLHATTPVRQALGVLHDWLVREPSLAL